MRETLKPEEQLTKPEKIPSNRRSTLKVLHVITRMIVGGAEWNTLYTCKLANRKRYLPLLATGLETGPEGSLIEMFLRRRKRLSTPSRPTQQNF